MLRIISGKYKGLKIEQPSINKTRPTMDRIKEAIFSSIHFDLENSICLDLFAGSGSLSLEAISRGAMKVIAIDNERESIEIIKANKNSLKANNLTIVNSDALKYLDRIQGTKYDFIFLDPPYEKIDLYNDSLDKIAKYNLLNELGKVIIEANEPGKIIIPKGMVIQKTKKYGKVHIIYVSNNI